MREILTLSKKLFEKWNSNNITYCHWKSNEHLFQGLIGETDLDILVGIKDRESAEKLLKETGFLKFKPQYGSRFNYVDDWIGCDHDSGRLIHIHLHYRMITGHKGLKEYDLPWTEYALEGRRLHEEFPIYVIDPNLELIILLSRICLKASLKRTIKSKLHKFNMSNTDYREFKYLQSHANKSEVLSIANKYMGKDSSLLTDLAFSSVFNSRWFEKSRKIIIKYLSKYNRYGSIVLLYRVYYSFVVKLRLGLKKKIGIDLITRKTMQNGAIIAFIGQDGAGKSTVSNEVLKWLSWKIDVRKYYLGSGEHYNSWQKVLRTKIRKKSGFLGIIHNILVVSDLRRIARNTYRKIKKAEEFASKGGIALFDRYPQIQFDGINDGPKIRVGIQEKKLPGFLKKQLLHYAAVEEQYLRKAVEIQPNLVFKMTLSPEESFRRKPEENLEKIKKKHEIINSLLFDSSEVITIDANQDFDTEIKSIHSMIWQYLINRGYVNNK